MNVGRYLRGEDRHVGTARTTKNKEKNPMGMPLPCDVKVGHVTIRKGVALSVLIARMQVLYDMAQHKLAQPAQQEPVAKVVSTAPERIWLDLGFAPSDEDEISFNDLVDATWSHDNATGFGIEYVRADIAAHGIKENT